MSKIPENIFSLFVGPMSVGERGSAVVVGWNDGDDENVWFRADGVRPDRIPNRLS